MPVCLTSKDLHKSIGDQVGTRHHRGRSSSISQDPKAMVMLSHFPSSFLDFFLFKHLSTKQASICLLRSSRSNLCRHSFDLGDSATASIARPAPPKPLFSYLCAACVNSGVDTVVMLVSLVIIKSTLHCGHDEWCVMIIFVWCV